MKTITNFTLIVFTFVITSLVSGGELFAQDTQLFDNSWYLQKLVINGAEHYPPSNTEVAYVDLRLYDNANNEFATNVCNSFFGELKYEATHSFTIMNSAMTLIFCNMQENSIFEGLYFGFFLNNNSPIVDPFSYVITTTGNMKELTITNNRGEKALYGNQILSNNAFDEVHFSLYPNPVQSTLHIQNQNSVTEATFQVFDINGKLITTKNPDTINTKISINVTHLKNGIYFLHIESKDGKLHILRFVKR